MIYENNRASVHPIIRSDAACGRFAVSAKRADYIDRQQRAMAPITNGATAWCSAANASSVTLTADVGS